jgi:Complex 1 protein (LYR family)
MLDRYVTPNQATSSAGPRQVVSTRRDALHLYRQIYRYTSLFDWRDDKGELWRDKLRRSARDEFEASKLIMDAGETTKLLLNSREAVDQVVQRFLDKRRQLEREGSLPRRLTCAEELSG